MARSVSGRDQSGDDPNSAFAATGSSQFDPSQYTLPIDSELTMTSNYPIPPFARELQENASSVTDPSAGQLPNTAVARNGVAPDTAIDPAMAPPQTPNQASFILSGSAPRASVDELSDPSGTPQTGEKRKRSKTSRACDECRRKKVRCDAPTEADGTPKTCSNCSKAGVTCDFERKPMKRGPSKGYIKELAERVQQVENVQKHAFRQSLDIGPYAESFSPDEPVSISRRQPSLTDPRNPFARSEYERDRIPSTGAWAQESSAVAGLRPRDAGSLAIAPDQSAPSAAPTRDTKVSESVQPFWSNAEAPPLPKRRRLDDPYAKLLPFKMDPGYLSGYYDYIHPSFALLPDAETVVEVVGSAVPSFQHAFAVAIGLLPCPRSDNAVNGNHINQASEAQFQGITDQGFDNHSRAFEKYENLAHYMKTVSEEDLGTHTDNDVLTCIWTLILLAAECENDVKQIAGSMMSKSTLITSSLRMIKYTRGYDTTSTANSFSRSRPEFGQLIDQAFYCLCILSKLHVLGHGHGLAALSTDDLVEKEVILGLAEAKRLPVDAAYLIHSSNILGLVGLFVHEEPDSKIARYFRTSMTEYYFRLLPPLYPPLDLQSPVVQAVKLFVELMLSRRPTIAEPIYIFEKTNELAAFLVSQSAKTPQRPTFNPFDMHIWALVTITLGEFVLNCSSAEFRTQALATLLQLAPLLQKRSEAFHRDNSHEWFWAVDTTKVKEYRASHWSDSLLTMIDDINMKNSLTVEDGGNDALIVPDFAALLQKGWYCVVCRYERMDED